jgi:hypothetical protein
MPSPYQLDDAEQQRQDGKPAGSDDQLIPHRHSSPASALPDNSWWVQKAGQRDRKSALSVKVSSRWWTPRRPGRDGSCVEIEDCSVSAIRTIGVSDIQHLSIVVAPESYGAPAA